MTAKMTMPEAIHIIEGMMTSVNEEIRHFEKQGIQMLFSRGFVNGMKEALNVMNNTHVPDCDKCDCVDPDGCQDELEPPEYDSP